MQGTGALGAGIYVWQSTMQHHHPCICNSESKISVIAGHCRSWSKQEHWASEQGPIGWQPTSPFAFFCLNCYFPFLFHPSDLKAQQKLKQKMQLRQKQDLKQKNSKTKADCQA